MTSGFPEDIVYQKANLTNLEFCSTEETQTRKRVTLDQLLQKKIQFEPSTRTFDFGLQLPENSSVLQFLVSRLTPKMGQSITKKEVILDCTNRLIDIWNAADCTPKTRKVVQIKVEKFYEDFQKRRIAKIRKKDKQFFQKQYPFEQIFDIVADKRHRAENFDEAFYEDQKSKRQRFMEEKINPSFLKEQEAQKKTAEESERRRQSQFMEPGQSTSDMVWSDTSEPELDLAMDSSGSQASGMEDVVPTSPGKIVPTRSRSHLGSRASLHTQEESITPTPNKCKCGINCHTIKPHCKEVSVQVFDVHLRKQKNYEDQANWPLRPVRGLHGIDGKHTMVDEKIQVLICQLAAVCNISIPASLNACEIMGNFFGSPWYQSGSKHQLHQETHTAFVKDPQISQKDICIENFLLPAAKTVREKEMLLALGTEREVGYLMLKSATATLHDDGTRKREIKGCIHGNQLTIDGVTRYLPARLLVTENQKNVVENIVTLLQRLASLTGTDKVHLWSKITALMTDLASENHFLAEKVAEHLQSSDVPGMPWCVLHTCLGFDRDLSAFHENLEGHIGRDKLKAALHTISDKSKVKNNLAAQTKDLALKFVAMENSSKPWNRAEEFSEFEEQRGRKNDAMLMKEGRFGRQCKASLKVIEMKDSLLAYLEHDSKCQNEVARLLRSLLPSTVVHYEWTLEVLVGYHLMEPFLGIMLDQQPRPTHLQLWTIFQNLYKQMMEPLPGLMFSSIERHALPALSDGFIREYKKEWLDSFCKHLEQYDVTKLESTMQVLMKQLGATLSRQHGIQYEFGPEFKKYSEKRLQEI